MSELDLADLADYLQGNSPDFPRQVISGFEVSLDHLPALKMVQHVRSFFSPRGSVSLGGGVEAWPGLFESVRPVQGGLVLNLDVSAATFVQARPVLEIACEVWRRRDVRDLEGYRVSDSDRKKLESTLYLCKVELTHRADMKRKIRVEGVSREGAASLR